VEEGGAVDDAELDGGSAPSAGADADVALTDPFDAVLVPVALPPPPPRDDILLCTAVTALLTALEMAAITPADEEAVTEGAVPIAFAVPVAFAVLAVVPLA